MSNYPNGYNPKDNPLQQDWPEVFKPTPTQEELEYFIAWLEFKDPVLNHQFSEMVGEDEVSQESVKWVLDRWHEIRKELTDKSKKAYDEFNEEFEVYDLRQQ